jgi:hypothetical protein
MSTTTLQPITFNIHLLSDAHAKGAIECITSTFLSGEPMTRALNIKKQDFYDFVELFINKAIAEGLSIVAKTPDTNRIIGCLVCQDFNSDLPQGIERVAESFAPIFELLGHLDDRYKARHEVHSGEMYHLFMGGVDREFAGQGIIHQMTHQAEMLARSIGFTAAIGEATGPVSQHVYLNHLGYKVLDAICYQDFLFEGDYVFRSITECESCKLIYKAL